MPRYVQDKRSLMMEALLRALGWREQVSLAQGLAALCTRPPGTLNLFYCTSGVERKGFKAS